MTLAHNHCTCIDHLADLIVMDVISCGADTLVKAATMSLIRSFKSDMRDAFSEQRGIVLGNMPTKGYLWWPDAIELLKAPGDEWLFDAVEWNEKLADLGDPYMTEAIAASGAEAMFDLIPDLPFNPRSIPMQEFVYKHKYKFSFNVNAETIKQLQREFATGIADGEGVFQLRKRVEKVFDIAEKFRSERIARSEIQRAAGAATEEAYIQSGLVEGKEWVANPGACKWCLDIHGSTMRLGGSFFDKGDSLTVDGSTMHFDYDFVKYPPAHPACMCGLIPIVAGTRNLIRGTLWQ